MTFPALPTGAIETALLGTGSLDGIPFSCGLGDGDTPVCESTAQGRAIEVVP